MITHHNELRTSRKSRDFWNNKRVLITGGSAGLGRELALALTKIGSKVAIIARTQTKLDEVKELEPEIIVMRADISNKEDIYRISGSAIGQLGGVDILINNASSLGPTPLKPLIDGECEEFEEVLQTNLLGPYRLTKAILPSMLFQKWGLIVNISSDAAVSPYPTWGFYGTSKAALDHMTNIWNEELKEQGINLVSLDPGDMYTDMHLAAIPDAKEEDLYSPKQVASELRDSIPNFVFNETSVSRYSASEWRVYLD